MAKQLTNADRMLQSVLRDPKLVEYGEYYPDDYETVLEALRSYNPCVQAVAKIIYGKDHDHTDKEIYNEVNNLLKTSL
jgi:cobalamin biosynthesis Co2+ chelatase CbiK